MQHLSINDKSKPRGRVATMEAVYLSFDVYTNMIQELKHKFEKVEFILKHFPEARNNDNYLIYLYWRLVDQCETLEDIVHATSPEVIRRARQKIQNELGLYQPTNDKVRKRRRQAEKVIRKHIHEL
jgi:hypothetical protein